MIIVVVLADTTDWLTDWIVIADEYLPASKCATSQTVIAVHWQAVSRINLVSLYPRLRHSIPLVGYCRLQATVSYGMELGGIAVFHSDVFPRISSIAGSLQPKQHKNLAFKRLHQAAGQTLKWDVPCMNCDIWLLNICTPGFSTICGDLVRT